MMEILCDAAWKILELNGRISETRNLVAASLFGGIIVSGGEWSYPSPTFLLTEEAEQFKKL